MNLMYLAIITERVPLIHRLMPLHVGHDAPTIDFGNIFDIPRLEEELGKPVLEWRHIKDPQSESIDNLGCRSVENTIHTTDDYFDPPGYLKLDISYTTALHWIKLQPNNPDDTHASFWPLASLSSPATRAANLQTPQLSPVHRVSIPPDERLLCFDKLNNIGAQKIFKFNEEFSPTWRFVERHMHWAPKVQAIVDSYTRRILGMKFTVNSSSSTIHARRDDFALWCEDVPIDDCFAPLSAFAEILSSKGVVVEHVIMTSDARNSTRWKAVAELGWRGPDHSRTIEAYGAWYPILIDAAMQSDGLGPVGTDRPTVSVLSRRRVSVWQDGVVRSVRWGKPGADDH
ncbi:hypothetical protein B0H10DRAFT_2161986 [Mycena sp. CBHHK59/15]|nr:hypothetical protein B0H10DRAFT_2161986 [Mycena sp. CBHHK59/15]